MCSKACTHHPVVLSVVDAGEAADARSPKVHHPGMSQVVDVWSRPAPKVELPQVVRRLVIAPNCIEQSASKTHLHNGHIEQSCYVHSHAEHACMTSSQTLNLKRESSRGTVPRHLHDCVELSKAGHDDSLKSVG
jgi:hypothetical protein